MGEKGEGSGGKGGGNWEWGTPLSTPSSLVTLRTLIRHCLSQRPLNGFYAEHFCLTGPMRKGREIPFVEIPSSVSLVVTTSTKSLGDIKPIHALAVHALLIRMYG